MPITCDTLRCPHCHVVAPGVDPHSGRITNIPAPLRPDDLRWWLCAAESRLGLRSTFGAFVDLAMSGIQGGGRSNGVERSWTDRKHEATARERCIRARLRGLAPHHLAVLIAAYSPQTLAVRAERLTGDRAARTSLLEVFGESLPVVLLTKAAEPIVRPDRILQAIGESAPGGLGPSPREGLVEVGGLQLHVQVRLELHEEVYDAVETDASLRARTLAAAGGELAGVERMESWRLDWAAEELGLDRHEVHLRRWQGRDERADAFVLGRLADLAQAALRARERAGARHRSTTDAERADARADRLASRMQAQAAAMLEDAHAAAGVVTELPRAPRQSAQRSREVVRAS